MLREHNGFEKCVPVPVFRLPALMIHLRSRLPYDEPPGVITSFVLIVTTRLDPAGRLQCILPRWKTGQAAFDQTVVLKAASLGLCSVSCHWPGSVFTG